MPDDRTPDVLFTGRHLSLLRVTTPQPIGQTREFEVVRVADAVCIVAVRPGADGRHEVALVRQPRPAIQSDLWELPAGVVGEAEHGDPARAAARELAEETGYLAGTWRRLASHYPSPGICTESITLYLATDLMRAPGPAGGRPADPTEIAAVAWLPLEEALAREQRGAVADGKTLLGLLLAQRALAEPQPSGGEVAMMLDPLDTPLKQAAQTITETVTRAGGPGELHAEAMLLEEFRYASSTAYQAMEDRARMFNLYLLLFGSFAAGLTTLYQLGAAQPYSRPVAIALMLVLGILGVAYFVKLVRLRQAFRDSLIAMNVVKEYYITHIKAAVPDIERAFRWRQSGIPKGERFGSVTFVVCYTVAFLASLSFGAAAFLGVFQVRAAGQMTLVPALGDSEPYAFAALTFFVSLLLHVAFFVRSLSEKRPRATPAAASAP